MQSLPTVSTIKDLVTRNAIEPIRDALSILGRNKGRFVDSAVLVSDLRDIGVIGVRNDTMFNPNLPDPVAMKDDPVLLSRVATMTI